MRRLHFSCQARATQLDAGRASQFVVAAHLGAPFIVPAAPSHGVEPQAALLRFLATEQPQKVFVDLVDQILRQAFRSEWMTALKPRPRGIERDRRPDSFATQAAAVAGLRFEHFEQDSRLHGGDPRDTARGLEG